MRAAYCSVRRGRHDTATPLATAAATSTPSARSPIRCTSLSVGLAAIRERDR
jgi:hypothetical protein